MRRRFLAPLLICVTLLAQLVAPIAAAGAMARMEGAEGAVACKMHAQHAAPSAESGAPAEKTNAGHDHASCVFCQLGVGAAPEIAPVVVSLRQSGLRAAVPLPAGGPAPESPYNRNAPARAPPSLV